MLYYSSNARKSAANKIDELNNKIGTIPGNYLNYTDAVLLCRFLTMLKEIIEKEQKDYERKTTL